MRLLCHRLQRRGFNGDGRTVVRPLCHRLQRRGFNGDGRTTVRPYTSLLVTSLLVTLLLVTSLFVTSLLVTLLLVTSLLVTLLLVTLDHLSCGRQWSAIGLCDLFLLPLKSLRRRCMADLLRLELLY